MSLTRAFSIGSLALAMAASVPAASASSGRVVTHEYLGASGSAGVVSAYPVIDHHGPLEVVTQPRPGERTLSLVINDSAEGAVAFVVSQNVHNGGERRIVGSGCGGTTTPMRLVSTEPVQVRLLMGNACDTASLPTRGTIKLVFRR